MPSGGPAGRLVSPLVRQPGSRSSPSAAQLKRISPSDYKPTSTNSTTTHIAPTVSPKQCSSRPGTPSKAKHLSNHVGNHTQTPTPLNNHSNAAPHLDPTNRTHAANKKRRRSDESNTSDGSSIKKSRTMLNGDIARPTERIKTAKVKTTVELIAELQAQKSMRLTASDTITKIVTNQIQKEEDDINASVVPMSARPRARRKNGSSGLPDPPADLSRTKSDLVHRFLQQTVQLANRADTTSVDESGHINVTDNFPDQYEATPVIDMSIDPYSLLPPLDYDAITWSEEETSDEVVHRNAITGEYPDGYEHSSSSSDGGEVPGDIVKVLDDQWDGVNGSLNVDSRFHEWTETFTISSDDNEKNNVHVLPYVDL